MTVPGRVSDLGVDCMCLCGCAGIEIDPYDGRAHIGLARIELRRRNVTGARDIYETALQFCNDNPFVLQVRFIVYQHAENAAQSW